MRFAVRPLGSSKYRFSQSPVGALCPLNIPSAGTRELGGDLEEICDFQSKARPDSGFVVFSKLAVFPLEFALLRPSRLLR